MPGYITSPQPTQVSAVYPGGRITLVNNAATDTGVTKTTQFAFGPTPGNATGNMVAVNQTNQQCQGQYAATDADANYENLSGCIVPAGSSLPYNLSGGWVRFTFASAPTTGSLVVSR